MVDAGCGHSSNQMQYKLRRFESYRSSISKLGEPFFSSFHQMSFSELGSLTTRLSRGLRPVLAPADMDQKLQLHCGLVRLLI